MIADLRRALGERADELSQRAGEIDRRADRIEADVGGREIMQTASMRLAAAWLRLSSEVVRIAGPRPVR